MKPPHPEEFTNKQYESVGKFRQGLLTWGERNIKEYPWRYTEDLFAILVAEFMLHRTQVAQVIPVYQSFMSTYPTLFSFSRADKEDVRRLLLPLGLRWRISCMIDALDGLWRTHGRVHPDPEQLLRMKGIGQYIANATICFARNKPVALVDGNTVRVTGRVFGLDLRGEARRRKAVIRAISDACIPSNPRDFYYAMIDLAHAICTPTDPLCSSCPLLGVPCVLARERAGGPEIQESSP